MAQTPQRGSAILRSCKKPVVRGSRAACPLRAAGKRTTLISPRQGPSKVSLSSSQAVCVNPEGRKRCFVLTTIPIPCAARWANGPIGAQHKTGATPLRRRDWNTDSPCMQGDMDCGNCLLPSAAACAGRCLHSGLQPAQFIPPQPAGQRMPFYHAARFTRPVPWLPFTSPTSNLPSTTGEAKRRHPTGSPLPLKRGHWQRCMA